LWEKSINHSRLDDFRGEEKRGKDFGPSTAIRENKNTLLSQRKDPSKFRRIQASARRNSAQQIEKSSREEEDIYGIPPGRGEEREAARRE
jgi:hypothetical protein